MPNEPHPYLFLAVFFLIAVGFPLIPIALARFWSHWYSPGKPGTEKNASYECGLAAKGDAWVQFQSHYYLYGLLFLVFDIEAIFLLPFGVAFLHIPAGAVLAMLVFLFFLAESLAWAWKKGILTWR